MLKNALSALYLLEGSIRPPPKVRAGGGGAYRFQCGSHRRPTFRMYDIS